MRDSVPSLVEKKLICLDSATSQRFGCGIPLTQSRHHYSMECDDQSLPGISYACIDMPELGIFFFCFVLGDQQPSLMASDFQVPQSNQHDIKLSPEVTYIQWKSRF
jgi:hypothetical protein